MCHSVNAAIMDTIQRGVVTSTSIMIPCAWAAEAADFLRAHPEVDVGVHLTVTSEWRHYRWRPLTQPSPKSALTDESGFFFRNAMALTASGELESELLAQIELATKLGINPTHLDSHMFALFGPQELLNSYVRVARSASLPFLLLPRLKTFVSYSRHTPVDNLMFINCPEGLALSWADWYDSILRSLQPGITELIVHPAFDGAETRAVMGDIWGCGATWRQRDYDVLTSARFRQTIQENNIELTTWANVSRLNCHINEEDDCV